MKKIIILIACITTFIVGFKLLKKKESCALYTIGILQTASHPALDAVKDGFIKQLKNTLGNSVDFVIKNAQGSIANAHTIAATFHSDPKICSILAIATPAAQAISALEKTKPIFLGAVTDPQALDLIYPETNVCGVNDMIDVAAQINLLTLLIPEAKTVGLLYTSGELNSQIIAQKMRTALESKGLQVHDFTITCETDLPAIVASALKKIDVLLAPTDNTVASCVTLISDMCLQNKKPFIVSDNLLVCKGPLAARGVDYYESGNEIGTIAFKVLTQKIKPCDLPIKNAKTEKVMINKTTLDILGLSIPSSLQETIVFV